MNRPLSPQLPLTRQPMRIAIVGAGISGLTAARLLHRHHEITVFEAADYIGGHTATNTIELDGVEHDVDTGFIVYNEKTYPNFIDLLDQLQVASQPTDMGFSVTTRHKPNPKESDFEYCGSTLNSLFADRRKLFDASFLGMLKDIIRFGKQAKRDVAEDRIDPALRLDEYLREGRYGRMFREFYIIPMASAIWSASTSRVGEFNAGFFVRFFYNHGLLNISDRPQWRVVSGGSRSYIPPLTAGFRDRIRLSSPVREVDRNDHYVSVASRHGRENYDQVIFACHSDQVLSLLRDPHPMETKLLQAIPYRENSVVMHTDETLLPRRRRAWASWNYLLDGTEDEQPILTYNMNILQGIKSARPICVTMNGDRYIDESKILKRFVYAHPQFGQHSVAAQENLEKINGERRSWFCGAYWRNGFHEDGVVSAMTVANGINSLVEVPALKQ